MDNSNAEVKILSIDIGGSHVKATILNKKGDLLVDYKRVETPSPASPKNLLDTIKTLLVEFEEYDYVSVGFPGYVKDGVVMTAPNLGTELWQNVNLKKILQDELGKPVVVVNDAD